MTQQRVAVITGASSGIGKEAARLLLAQGWHVIGHGRDAERTASAQAELAAVAQAHGGRFEMLRGDLSLVSGAEALATAIAALTPRVDALLANAGGVRAEKAITAEGNEATFAGNHLGHFHLVNRLLPLLAAGAQASETPARVILTSSSGHHASPPFDWEDPQMLNAWESGPAYCRVKLYNILHARELARRVADRGVVAHAMHPGRVATNFFNQGDATMQAYAKSVPLDPPGLSAETLAWLASDPQPAASTGRFWHAKAEETPSEQAQDDAAAARLWAESEKLVARAGF